MFRITLTLKSLTIGMITPATAFFLTFIVIQKIAADTQLVTYSFNSASGQASSRNLSTKMTMGQSSPSVSSSSENFESDGGYWSQDVVSPSTIGDLTATLSSTDIVLQWSHAADNVAIDHYVVYRGTNPDFSATSGDSINGTKGTSYLDPGAAGTVGTDYFYVVKAADPSRNYAEDSNRVGEFDADMENGVK
jgi:hypothetical protein